MVVLSRHSFLGGVRSISSCRSYDRQTSRHQRRLPVAYTRASAHLMVADPVPWPLHNLEVLPRIVVVVETEASLALVPELAAGFAAGD